MTACQLKVNIPLVKKKWCKYRSFRNFDVDLFNNGLSNKLNLGGHNFRRN